ncbi:MAG: hypothetical protein EXS32_00055 [Opitutus sp.]|nr:hypothetical protein [Opitutus sp.]
MPAAGPRRKIFIDFPMKRLGLAPLVVSATLFLTVGLRAAEMKPAGSPAAMKASRVEDILRRFDLNHDGKLDDDETAAAHEVLLKEQLNRQAAQAAATNAVQFRERMLAMFDKNHDGQLDDDERAAARKYGEERGLGENGAIREDLIKRFDQNGDGQLDESERAALQKFLQARLPRAGGAETAADQQARLDKVAEEVARRRAERQQRELAKAKDSGK